MGQAPPTMNGSGMGMAPVSLNLHCRLKADYIFAPADHDWPSILIVYNRLTRFLYVGKPYQLPDKIVMGYASGRW